MDRPDSLHPPPAHETTIVKGKSVLSLTKDEPSVLVLLKAGANPDEQVGLLSIISSGYLYSLTLVLKSFSKIIKLIKLF